MFKADIMKLELKHIAPYLPYKLMFLEVRRGMFSNSEDIAEQSPMNVGNINSLLNGKVYRVISRKPILRPLSDLLKLGSNVEWWSIKIELGIPKYLEYDSMQELLKEHYDVFGLIENNLAIDINTLK